MHKLALNIHELSLHGFSRMEAARVEDAFRAELTRLSAADMGAAQSSETLSLNLAPGSSDPGAIGALAAWAIFAGGRG